MYTIVEELNIPRAMQLPEPPLQLILQSGVTIVLYCEHDETAWAVEACVVTDAETMNTQPVGKIVCHPLVDRESVLKVAEDWVRGSDSLSFIPGRVILLGDQSPLPMRQGVILGR